MTSPTDAATAQPEPWLRGPLAGVPQLLMPAAHALVQAREDVERVVATVSPDALWSTPGGAASVGFHLRHIAGSVDRLLTYALGRQLADQQRAALQAETTPPPEPRPDARTLGAAAIAAIDRAIEVIRAADPQQLHMPREVGRARLPSSMFGLLFHVAEHTQRHVGQLITTAKVVAGGA